MARNTLKTGIATALLGATLLAGCFTTEDDYSAVPKPNPIDTVKVQKPDTTKDTSKVIPKPDTLIKTNPNPDTGKGNPIVIHKGWDDFPNKYLPTLKEFSAKMTKLPAPYGLRYDALPLPNSKIAAGPECPEGPKEIFGMSVAERKFYVVDTLRYYSLTGEVGCRWFNGNMAKVTHNRHILDLNAGEAWEQITDSIAGETTVLPHHSLTGTGFMRLNSKLEFQIRSWRVEMATPPSAPAIVRDGHLKFDWKDGYAFEMEIVKQMPFEVSDLFHVKGETVTEKVMSGPILHPGSGQTAGMVDTLGFIDLHSDHSVVIRDWTGKVVTP